MAPTSHNPFLLSSTGRSSGRNSPLPCATALILNLQQPMQTSRSWACCARLPGPGRRTLRESLTRPLLGTTPPSPLPPQTVEPPQPPEAIRTEQPNRQGQCCAAVTSAPSSAAAWQETGRPEVPVAKQSQEADASLETHAYTLPRGYPFLRNRTLRQGLPHSAYMRLRNEDSLVRQIETDLSKQ